MSSYVVEGRLQHLEQPPYDAFFIPPDFILLLPNGLRETRTLKLKERGSLNAMCLPFSPVDHKFFKTQYKTFSLMYIFHHASIIEWTGSVLIRLLEIFSLPQ